MPRKDTGFAVVRTLGLALPGVEEGTAYGSPALNVRGRMFACVAIHRSAEPNTLVVRIGFDQRDELIENEPKIYYLTEHYVNYPCVLVRLTHIREDALRGLLLMGWQFMSTKEKREDPRIGPCGRSPTRPFLTPSTSAVHNDPSHVAVGFSHRRHAVHDRP